MAFVLERAELPAPRSAAAGGAAAAPRRNSLWRRLFARPAPKLETSPWGAILDANEIAPGVIWFSTAARKGYRLAQWRQRALPRSFRTEDGWYEDSMEWASVGVVFDREFDRLPARDASDASLYQVAKEILRHWRPEEYESWFQTTLDEAEIDSLAVMQFHRLHAARWIVLDAFDDRAPFVAVGCLHVRAK